MDMNHWKVSYFQWLMGYSSVWGVGELALWGGASVTPFLEDMIDFAAWPGDELSGKRVCYCLSCSDERTRRVPRGWERPELRRTTGSPYHKQCVAQIIMLLASLGSNVVRGVGAWAVTW